MFKQKLGQKTLITYLPTVVVTYFLKDEASAPRTEYLYTTPITKRDKLRPSRDYVLDILIGASCAKTMRCAQAMPNVLIVFLLNFVREIVFC